MEKYQSLYDQFVQIVGEDTCSEGEIKKYLQWGKGSLEHSLNYYFQQDSKKISSQPSAGSQSRIASNNAKKPSNQPAEKTPSLISRHQLQKQQDQGQVKQQSSYPLKESPSPSKLSDDRPNAFQKLREGSRKQKDFDRMVDQLRYEYAMPVTSVLAQRSSQEALSTTLPQFSLDYLPSVLTTDPQPFIAKKTSLPSSKLHVDEIVSDEEQQRLRGITKIEIKTEEQQSDVCLPYEQTATQSYQRQGESIESQQLCEKKVFDMVSEEEDKQNIYNQDLVFKQTVENKGRDSRELEGDSAQKKKSTKSFEAMNKDIEVITRKDTPSVIKFPCDLGSFLLSGHALTSSKCEMQKGDEIILRIERNVGSANTLGQQKTKKSGLNVKKPQQIIRLIWKGRSVGRVDEQYEETLFPLLERGYIIVEGRFEHAPKQLQTFSPIRVIVTVQLLALCITKPITKIIDEKNDQTKEGQILCIYSYTKAAFANLFVMLRLEKTIPTLISPKDKKSKVNSSAQKKSILNEEGIQGQEENKQQKAEEAKEQLEKEQAKDMIAEEESSQQLPVSELKEQHKTKFDLNDPFAKPPKQQSLNFYKLRQSDEISLLDQNEVIRLSIQTQDKQSTTIDISNQDLFDKVGSDNSESELKYSNPPSSTFKTELHNYQRQALTWMLSREGKQTEVKGINRNLRVLHPLWEQYHLSSKQLLYIYFNPYTGQLSFSFPRAHSECRGGILADEMGLGKTVMMLSLIHSNKQRGHDFIPNDIIAEDEAQNIEVQQNFMNPKIRESQTQLKPFLKNFIVKSKQSLKNASTLIVVPVTLLAQWGDEIQLHSVKGSITYMEYYSSNRRSNQNNLANYDVVLTTYGILTHEFFSKNSRTLFNYNWHRIVLDEAHYIKGRTIQTAKAAYGLIGDNRWCMSGTPLQNKLDELFPLLHFIKMEPWNDYTWWNQYINKPHEAGEQIVYEVLKTILSPILLRRTKKSKDAKGKCIIELPEKYSRIQFVKFTQEERTFYDRIYKDSKEKFDGPLKDGLFLLNYMKVFELLLRLRQICDHIFMVTTRGDMSGFGDIEAKIRGFVKKRNKAITSNQGNERKAVQVFGNKVVSDNFEDDPQSENYHSHFEIILNENNQEERIEISNKQRLFDINEQYLRQIIQSIQNNEITTCNICLEDMEDAVVTACLHIQCRLCAIRSIEFNGVCPICRKLLTREDLFTVPRKQRFSFNAEDNYVRSSKINAVMQYIQELKKTNDKCLLFTQFLGVMDLFEIDFKQSNIPYLVKKDNYFFLISYLTFLPIQRLDGSCTQKERAVLIKRFNEEDNQKVFMISLKAGGVGLNLVSANHVLLVDPWWNPAVEEQAIERCHRIGQKKVVHVVRFICEDTIESRMIKLHEEKRDLFYNTIQTVRRDKKEANIEYFKYLMSNN